MFYKSVLLESFLTIKLATKDSRKLSGMAKGSSPAGRTPMFHVMIHIKTKPTNHDKMVV